MRILAIETSCDETSAAVVACSKNKVRILSNIIGSQIKTHGRYGGVVPELAARGHANVIIDVVQKAIEEAVKGSALIDKGVKSSFDAIAVTYGPGLMVSLLVGVEAAKSLAYAWDKPFIGVNHLEGHVYSVLADGAVTIPNQLNYPFVSLVVSGGHTELVLVKSYGKYKLLGRTRDDAAGEAFDKVASLLGLPYPGGPAIADEAAKGDANAYNMPRAMLNSNNFDFSFSGIKTHVKYSLKDFKSVGSNFKLEPKDLKSSLPNIAASFQEAMCDILVAKTIAAALYYNVKHVVVTGGVSSNDRLREKFREAEMETGLSCYFPVKSLTGDNAAMIGIAGYLKYAHTKKFDDIFTIRPNPQMKWTGC